MSGLLELHPPEVLVIQVVWELHTAKVQLGLGGDHIPLVDATQWTAIQVVRAFKIRKDKIQLIFNAS